MKRYRKSITAAYPATPPNPYDTYEPEEDKYEHIDTQESIELSIGPVVHIDEDGTFDYEDYDWAELSDDEEKGIWYSDEYPSLILCDTNEVDECVSELISDLLPEEPGRYAISANITLVFDVENIEENRDYYPDGSYDVETYFDDTSVHFNKKKSKVEDFYCMPIA